jgi:6-phosphofructokinase 1
VLDFLVQRGITQLFCIGGDGTQRGARELAAAAKGRGLDIAIIGIPKTIDNDVPYCDRTFGYSTAVEAARNVIEVAHVEAKGALQGVGLVKLMGRDAGFIACGATIASQKVNFTLVPEQRLALDGPGGFLAALEARMDRRDHAIVVVAEGAGQEHFEGAALGRDASGNRRYGDIGTLLRERIVAHFRAVNKPMELKYIDPSYMIRGIPANCEDGILCDQLARGAVHAAMAGRTGMMISLLNSCFIHVPIALAVGHKKRVDLNGPLWPSVLAATGQPAEFTGAS